MLNFDIVFDFLFLYMFWQTFSIFRIKHKVCYPSSNIRKLLERSKERISGKNKINLCYFHQIIIYL